MIFHWCLLDFIVLFRFSVLLRIFLCLSVRSLQLSFICLLISTIFSECPPPSFSLACLCLAVLRFSCILLSLRGFSLIFLRIDRLSLIFHGLLPFRILLTATISVATPFKSFDSQWCCFGAQRCLAQIILNALLKLINIVQCTFGLHRSSIVSFGYHRSSFLSSHFNFCSLSDAILGCLSDILRNCSTFFRFRLKHLVFSDMFLKYPVVIFLHLLMELTTFPEPIFGFCLDLNAFMRFRPVWRYGHTLEKVF